MNGIINVLKPPGMTSHDVVAYLRRLLQIRAIGHTGTLDPGVAGVLPVCVGTATRVAEFVSAAGKTYRAELTLGITTDSLDGFGRILERRPVHITYDQTIAAIPSFTGWIKQIPPMVSAVKKGGRRLYEFAREGREIAREARDVFITRITPLAAKWNREFPCLLFDVDCSKGTYIRTLCADWGDWLGCGGHMSYLLRTRSGPFTLDEAWTLEELRQAVDTANYRFLLPLDSGLGYLPKAIVAEHRVTPLLNGLSLAASDYRLAEDRAGLTDSTDSTDSQWVRLYSSDGCFLALGLWQSSGEIRPKKVFAQKGESLTCK